MVRDKARLRVATALDALAQIEAGLRIPTEMRYVQAQESDGDLHVTAKNKCQVCALGSLFLARVGRLRRPLPFSMLSTSPQPIYDLLAEVFDKEQLALIEATFEHWGLGAQYQWAMRVQGVQLFSDELIASLEFGRKYDAPADRLVAILENIVRNGGTFVPTDLREGFNQKSPPEVPQLGTCTIVQDYPPPQLPVAERILR